MRSRALGAVLAANTLFAVSPAQEEEASEQDEAPVVELEEPAVESTIVDGADEPPVPAWPYTPPRDPEAIDTLVECYFDSNYNI